MAPAPAKNDERVCLLVASIIRVCGSKSIDDTYIGPKSLHILIPTLGCLNPSKGIVP